MPARSPVAWTNVRDVGASGAARVAAGRSLWLLLLLAVASAGCTQLRHPFKTASAQLGPGRPSQYDSVELRYRLDAGRLGVPVALAAVEGQLVSFQQVASSPVPDSSVGTLIVQYPHPAGRADAALAGLVIESESGMVSSTPPTSSAWRQWLTQRNRPRDEPSLTDGKAAREAWVLDITREELDQVLATARSQGADAASSRETGVRLAVWVNGKQQRQDGRRVEALDGLMRRIRAEGQLVSYHRPAGVVVSGEPRGVGGPVRLVSQEDAGRTGRGGSGLSAPDPPASLRMVRLPEVEPAERRHVEARR